MPKLCIILWSVTGIAIPDEAVTYGQQKSGGIIVIQIFIFKIINTIPFTIGSRLFQSTPFKSS